MKTITAITLMVSLIFLARSPALADDTDLFGANIEPNVMLLIDTSSSMKEEITSTIYDPDRTYSGSYTTKFVYKGATNDYTLFKKKVDEVTNASARNALSTDGYWIGQIAGSTVSLFLGNYLNYQGCTSCTGQERKIDIAKRVFANLIENVEGVRFGVMRLRKKPDSLGKRGEVIAPIGTDKTTMVNAVNNIVYESGTGIGEQLYDAGQYYKGLPLIDGNQYSSPIQYECQPNFIVLMTDGRQNGDLDIRDEATNRFTQDHAGTLSGIQNVIVHTIGFDLSEDEDDQEGLVTLQQAAVNGGGNSYSAENSAQLELALVNTIRQIIPGTFSFANPAIPSTSVTGSTKAYIASFKSDAAKPFWRGFLKAYERDPNNGKIRVLADDTPDPQYLVWDAGQKLSAKLAADRTIYTATGGSLKEFTKSESSIGASDLGVSTSAERDKIIDFIRGIDSTDEDGDGNVTEERDWKLGDIFHSAPVVVSPPVMPSTEQSYIDFKNANSARTTVVIVGANDGMLHAFRESDGEELWAFIPTDILGSLKDLTVHSGRHGFYVDSSPIAADIRVAEGGSKQWKTIVVFGLRRGGKSYYALDITDTEDPKFLWTFTDPKMGETWSEPAIGQVNKGNGEYVAFVGGGYDTDSNNSSGRAFFAIDLATGGELWEYYNDGSSGDRNYMNFSLAANPTAADLNSDGFIDRVYIGDVGGQLWKFDVSGETSGMSTGTSYTYEFVDKDSVTLQREFTEKVNNGVTQIELKVVGDVSKASPPAGCTADCYAYSVDGQDPASVSASKLGYVGGLDSSVYGSGTTFENLVLVSTNSGGSQWTGKRLFAADSSQTNPPPAGEYYPAQAIYGAPALSLDDKGNLWTYFGTGDRNHPSNVSTNRFYGIKDTNPASTLTESDLLQVTSTVTSVDSSVQGWFFTLGSNEKVLAAADVFNSIVLFSSFTPTDTAVCGSGGGTAKLYAVQTVTGFAAVDFTTGDALVSTDGSVSRARVIGTGIPSKPTVIIDSSGNPSVITGTSNQEIDDTPLPPVSMKTLIGWREVF